MILVDSSAWIEFLRDTDSPACREVDRLLSKSTAITDPVLMEVLAGARHDEHARQLRGLLGRATLLRCETADFSTAALLHRVCRSGGETVRSLFDCLIAAVALRHDVPVLTADADFDVLARYASVRLHRPR